MDESLYLEAFERILKSLSLCDDDPRVHWCAVRLAQVLEII